MNPAGYVLLPLLFLSLLVLCRGQDLSRICYFDCARLGRLYYPFVTGNQSCGGLIAMNCTASQPKARFHEKGKWHPVNNINYLQSRIEIHDEDLQSHLLSNRCDLLQNFSEQAYLNGFNKEAPPSFISFNITETRPFFKCKRGSNFPLKFVDHFFRYRCIDYDLYYTKNEGEHFPALPANLSANCSVVRLPARDPEYGTSSVKDNLTLHWGANFTIQWEILPICSDCLTRQGVCQRLQNKSFQCSMKDESSKGDNVGRKIAIGLGTGVGCTLLTCIAFIFYIRRKENKLSTSSSLLSRDLFRDNSFKLEPGKGSIFFQTQIFSYKELIEATNNFDRNKELGGGGFATVYRGKLHDGRIVAVKRLFEHNSKRVEQFMNEVAILSRLSHKNLVPLYGCATHHGHELLIVYEFISNGTLADHIHGKHTEDGLLTWPIRMSIAVESAEALAYLHASEIIHRDVKSSNILLDNNFHVKVADFGLSRSFPIEATHVSTSPQGTPGYVDPEYYQCYKLNKKSDVYSFGVVLLELISSKPAVDIARNHHEINLANMAINKIHNQALREFVDPSLGYDIDYNVRNMIDLVAELAFRCLQQDNKMRPCMKEVLEILHGIENSTNDMDTSDVNLLLKKDEPLSSDTVIGKWPSKDTTPNTSG